MRFIEEIFDKAYKILCPEEYLINLLCQYSLKPGQNSKDLIISYIKKGNLDLKRFVKIVITNKLSSPILETLRKVKMLEKFPKAVKKTLIKEVLITKFLDKKQKENSRSVLKNLLDNHSSFVVMKYYSRSSAQTEEASIRKHEDIDLLIPVNEFRSVSELLLSKGYLYYPECKPFDGLKFIPDGDFYLPDSEELFIKEHHNIELHLKIIDVFGYYPPLIPSKSDVVNITQELFNSAKPFEFLDIKVKTFPPTQIFLSLFLHSFFHHNMQSRVDFYETSIMLDKLRSEIDWNYIFKFVERFNLKQYFLWYSSFLNDLQPGIIPDKFLKIILRYRKSFKVHQHFLYWLLKYKVFHPTKSFENPKRRFEYELYWAVIKGKLIRLILHKMRGIRYPYFK